MKCSDCQNRKFTPVTDTVIRNHLTGEYVIGAYPLLLDEACYFLAVDFDKSSWKEDTSAYIQTCKELGIPASLERSRSGNGGARMDFLRPSHPGFARVTQIMNLLKLNKYIQDTLQKLSDRNEILFFSEKRLREIPSIPGQKFQIAVFSKLVSQMKSSK